jgi:hypothetical protein
VPGILPELQAHLGVHMTVWRLVLGPWRRSGVRIAKAIVVPPWGSSAGGVLGTMTSSLSFSGVASLAVCLSVILVLFFNLFTANSAVSARIRQKLVQCLLQGRAGAEDTAGVQQTPG